MADETKKAGGTDAAQEPQETQEIQKTQEAKEKYNPKLDPRSPEFDKEAWKQANKGKSLTELLMSVSPDNYKLTYTEETAEEAGKAIAAAADLIAESTKKIAQPELLEAAANVYKHLEPVFKGVTDVIKSIDFIDFEATRNFVKMAKEFIEALPEIQKSLILNDEYIQEELKKPEYSGVDLEEIYKTDVDENYRVVPGSTLDKILSAVEKRQEKEAKEKENLPQITVKGKGAESTEYPVDKVNATVWTLLVNAEKNGQLTFAAERSGSKKTADIIYSINFDDLAAAGLNTDRRLTVFDKRVQIAASALYNSSGAIMTISQIYATMGNDSRPNKRDIERIFTSLEKMRLIPISLDNTSEHTLYPNYEKFIYNGVILPWEGVDAVINGQRVEGAIHLFREPPLVSFAKSRNQVTTISRSLLTSPISKTEVHLLIDDYLIERISRLKNSHGKVSNKLLYTTIYAKAGIKNRLQRSRAKETIIKYLEHYKNCGFINGYKEATDGVNILY